MKIIFFNFKLKMTTVERLLTLPDEIIEEVENRIDSDDYSFENNEEFLKQNKKYINAIFNTWSRQVELPEDIFLYMLELGLNINQAYSGMDGDNDRCNFAVHCAEFRQFNIIKLMLENGLILPTKKTISRKNNIIDALISGHSHGDTDYSVFEFIEDNLKDHPLILSEGTVEMIRDFYLNNSAYTEYYPIIVNFLCIVIIQQIKK